MCNNKYISEEIENLKRLTDELMSENDILIESNKKYQIKYENFFYSHEFFKDFFSKYSEFIAQNFGLNSPKNFETINEKAFDIFTNPQKVIKGMKKIAMENGPILNMSLLDVSDYENLESEQKRKSLVIDFFKNYLIDLSKELDNNEKLNIVMKNAQKFNKRNNKGSFLFRRTQSFKFKNFFSEQNCYLPTKNNYSKEIFNN